MSYKDLAKKQLSYIDKRTDEFLDFINNNYQDFTRELVKELKDLKTDSNGAVLDNEANRKLLNSLGTRVQSVMKRIGFDNAVLRLVSSFDEINKNIAAIHKDANNLNIAKSSLDALKKWGISQVTYNMQGAGMDNSLVQPVRETLAKTLATGGSLVDLITEIQDSVGTTPTGTSGIFQRYMIQVSRDALHGYDGLVNDKIRNQYNLDAIEYVGSLVKDSRAQCDRWVDMEKIPLTQLQDEIDWAYDNGTGMQPNTTPSNFCEKRGGYNCRHYAIPTRLDNE